MKNPIATLYMENGAKIKIELLPEAAPNTVNSFIFAASRGYMDHHAIERIVPGDWIDVSYTAFGARECRYLIPNEFTLHPEIEPLDSHPGFVCMGGYGEAGLASCEFFFPLRDCPEHKGVYPVFGKVLEGMQEIYRLEKVETVPVDFPISGVEVNKPVKPQVIDHVELELWGEQYPEPVKVPNPELPPTWKQKVIIDCDPGIDDALALMLALKSPEIEVVGITTVYGNTPAEMGFENAKRILKQMNRLDVPVYVGVSKPAVREYADSLNVHGEDGLGGSYLPEVPGYRQELNALEYLRTILKQEKVSVIALGPMTNLAALISLDKEAFGCIDEIVSMGGSYKSHGNISPVAEYNYWCDPDGAALVYKTAKEMNKTIHMVGLDVTRQVVLTPTILEYMCRLNPEMGEFTRKITGHYFDFHWEAEHLIGCVINDPLAVAYFIDRNLCKCFDSYVQIETQSISIGQSVVDAMDFYHEKHNSRVLTEADAYGFFRMFLSRVLDVEESELDILEDIL